MNWSPLQREYLREMGYELMSLRAAEPAPAIDVPAMLARVARGVDLAPLLAHGLPRDVAGRRALWRALRPLRKALRSR